MEAWGGWMDEMCGCTTRTRGWDGKKGGREGKGREGKGREGKGREGR